MGHDQGQFEGAGDQSAGLHPLHPGHRPQVVADTQQIDHLSTAHALGARRGRQAQHQFRAHGGIGVGVGMGEDFEG